MRIGREKARLAGVVLLFLAVAGLATASSTGRDYSRCIKSCNAANQECNAQCNTDCKALCGSDSSCVNACVANCKATTCQVQAAECKLICQSIKNNPSPTQP
jgi:hypothetical protein